MLRLDQINAMDRAAFVAALGGVFEHSPWVAESAYAQRPFASVAALHEMMCAVVDAARPADQLGLICAHPQLAGKAAIRGELTEASTREQQGAGLDRCTPEQYTRLTQLNTAYEARFGFPFIIAVRGHTRDSIIAAMAQRLENTPQEERAEALHQIARIAGFRLGDMIRE